MNKECELVRDRQERFNMVRCWFVVAWRLVDPITKKDQVQPWFKTKTEARKFAKTQGWSIISEEK